MAPSPHFQADWGFLVPLLPGLRWHYISLQFTGSWLSQPLGRAKPQERCQYGHKCQAKTGGLPHRGLFLSVVTLSCFFLPPLEANGSPTAGLSTGAIVGILIVIFVLLLVVVDITCYFLNKCGLLMCIAVNLCGKAGPGAKGKDMEEGKAAFS